MTGTVSVLSIICMAVSCVVGLAIPVILFIYFRKKKKADILPFFIGCAVMLVFALIIEAAIHRVVLSSSAGQVILDNIWLYALYGGLMAGIFEETGRFIAFKTVLKKKQDKNVNALMYGAGHGGFEAAVVLSVAMINQMIWSVLINSGNMNAITGTLSGEELTQAETIIQQLLTSAPYGFLTGSFERIFAVILQISLSVLVWFAAKNKKRLYLYPVAILIHFVVDAAVVVLQDAGISLILIEIVICVFSIAAAFFAKAVWNREGN